MSKVEFDIHIVPARKDLISFIEERTSIKDLFEKIGKDPNRWVEELNIIRGIVTGDGLTAGIGFFPPPKQEKEWRQIGEGTYYYSGKIKRLRGLWLSPEISKHKQWTHYKLNSNAQLLINKEFNNISLEDLLPENFEPKSKIVKGDKRPILTFEHDLYDKIYAKGNWIGLSFFYDPPSYRLTNIAGISKTTAKKEMEVILKLREKGIGVPEIIGYYVADFEEFLFLREVKGKPPDKCFKEHREEIIKQDARLLAALCQLGYRKLGFTSFDDKIFDGKKLYLIDTEEIFDLYFIINVDFRSLLLDPSDNSKLRKFRNNQRYLFKRMLKDAIYDYKDNMLEQQEHRRQFILAFYKQMNWKKPNKKEIKNLSTFEEGYITLDSYIATMSECD